MRRRAGERPGHGGTTAHFQAVYPFLGQGGLGAPGAYIGRDAYGGAWMYDEAPRAVGRVKASKGALVVSRRSNKYAVLKEEIHA